MNNKMNIHLALDDQAIGVCREVNQAIRRVAPSIIVFDEMSPMIPHISLAMGRAMAAAFATAIPGILERLAKAATPIRFGLRTPYLEDVRGRYVFAELEAPPEFFSLREVVRDQVVRDSLMELQNDYTPVPHITLAHVEENGSEVSAFLSTVRMPPSITAVALEYSDVGPKGTCLGSLYTVPFRRPSDR